MLIKFDAVISTDTHLTRFFNKMPFVVSRVILVNETADTYELLSHDFILKKKKINTSNKGNNVTR